LVGTDRLSRVLELAVPADPTGQERRHTEFSEEVVGVGGAQPIERRPDPELAQHTPCAR
jgi:hypothetical protein